MAAGFRTFNHKIIADNNGESVQSHRRSNSDPNDAQEFYNDISTNAGHRQGSPNRYERSHPYDESHNNVKHKTLNQSVGNNGQDDRHGRATITTRHQSYVRRSQSWYESDRDKRRILKRHHQLNDDSRQALDDVRSMLTELNDEIQNGFNRITFTQVMDAMISELRNCLQLCQEEYNRGSNRFANVIDENQQQRSNQRITGAPIDGIYRITKPQHLNPVQQLYPYDFLYNSSDKMDTTDNAQKYDQQGNYDYAKRRHSLPEYSSNPVILINDDAANLPSNQAGSSIQHFTKHEYADTDHNRLDQANISHASQYVIPDIKKSRNDLIKEITTLREKLKMSTSRLQDLQSEYSAIKLENNNLKSISQENNVASNQHHRYCISLRYNINSIFTNVILSCRASKHNLYLLTLIVKHLSK